MSQEEMRDFCESIQPYQLNVQVRLKNGQEIYIGKIIKVKNDRFEMELRNDESVQVRFAWVAAITNAA